MITVIIIKKTFIYVEQLTLYNYVLVTIKNDTFFIL